MKIRAFHSGLPVKSKQTFASKQTPQKWQFANAELIRDGGKIGEFNTVRNTEETVRLLETIQPKDRLIFSTFEDSIFSFPKNHRVNGLTLSALTAAAPKMELRAEDLTVTGSPWITVQLEHNRPGLIKAGSPDLTGSSLPGLIATSAIFDRADLSKVDLKKAQLFHSSFVLTNLTDTNLEGASLAGADFKAASLNRANLSDADFRDAELNMANLAGAVLDKTDFTNAKLRKATLWLTDLVKTYSLKGADLRRAEGLPFGDLIYALLRGARV